MSWPEGISWTRIREWFLSIDEVNSTLAPDGLTGATLLYIAIPNLIFLGGWLKPPFAAASVLLACAALWQFLRQPNLSWRQPYSGWALIVITASALVWCCFGGAGHFFYANPDWHVRDTVLGDLVLTDWPPAYGSTDGAHHILRTAFGYFFPAAVLGKLFGLGVVDAALYLWTAIGAGLFLTLLPLPRRAGGLLILLVLVAIFFSGMDALGIVLVTGELPIFPLRLEWWVPFSYTSITGQLYWAPNHALPLWLVTVLFYRHWGHCGFFPLMVLLLPLLMIWTPFAVAGILPFLCLAAARHIVDKRGLSGVRVTAIQFIFAALLTYLTIRLLTLGIATIKGVPTAELAHNTGDYVKKYLLFALMEFAILALLVAREIRNSFGLFWLSFAILALLPLYQYGPSNDTLLRLSTPCLIFLQIAVIIVVKDWAARARQGSLPGSAWLIGITLLIGACTPFNEIWRGASSHHTPPNYAMSLVEEQNGFEPPHYIGQLNRADLILLLRPPSPVPDRNERIARGLVPADLVRR